MLKKILPLIVIVSTSIGHTTSFADTAPRAQTDPRHPHAIHGDWVPPDEDAVIRVGDCSDLGLIDDVSGKGKLCAVLLRHAYENLSDKDALNPDPVLQKRALVGVDILNGLKQAGSKNWKGGKGTLYDPRTGNSYSSKVKLLGPDTLKITGCIAPGLCKGYIWQRAPEGLQLKQGTLVAESVKNRSEDSGTSKADNIM